MERLYAVIRTSTGTFGQTEVGEHATSSSRAVNPCEGPATLAGALMSALTENTSGNFTAARWTGGPLEILTEDVRLDTAAVVVELRAGNCVEVGFGSTGAVRIVPVPAGEWPVRDGRYVPAGELFPARSSKQEAENLRYQRALMGR